MDCFAAVAPSRKRFAFVAGNDGLWPFQSHAAPQRRFPACQNHGTGGASEVADPITGRAPNKEAAMGQDVRSPRGPRCIALVGPFQSGKTTLLEARSEEHTSELQSQSNLVCRL